MSEENSVVQELSELLQIRRDKLKEMVDSGCDPFKITKFNCTHSTQDICTKYINPPETTDFAVMFLPFEGLYAEAVNLGMIETLQRDYHIIIAGPSTMSTLLNSLRIGFQSMAIQKQSDNVWYVLNEVKKEFDKFADALEKTQTKLESANSELEKLVGTRTKLMRKQLEKVVEIDNKSNQNGV